MPGAGVRLPRSVWPLLILLIAAVVILWQLRGSADHDGHVRGGRLFASKPQDIQTLILTRLDGQYRFDRSPDGTWSLTGAVADYLSANAMDQLIANVVVAEGGPVLAGSAVEDRRYEFNGEGAMRLTVITADGTQNRLALGAVNPVTRRYYASGAGRNASFTVEAGLREVLASLPATVQSPILLPLKDRDRVTGIELAATGRTFVLQRRDGRWWMKQRGVDQPDLGPLIDQYQNRYDDRTLTDDEGTWLAADYTQVDGLIYEVSAVTLTGIVPLDEAVGAGRMWGLDNPPWRITLQGDGINPDARNDSPDRLDLALSPAGEKGEVAVDRRGNVLLTSSDAVRILEQGPVGLADTGYLPFRLAAADSFHLDGNGGPVIWARPESGRWRSYRPPGYAFRDSTRRTGMEANDLVVNLDRGQLVAVLPPTRNGQVLEQEQRLRLTAWFTHPNSGDTIREVVDFGRLAPAQLPPGAETVDYAQDDLVPVGIWSPGTGRLLQIPGYVMITGHNFRDNYLKIN